MRFDFSLYKNLCLQTLFGSSGAKWVATVSMATGCAYPGFSKLLPSVSAMDTDIEGTWKQGKRDKLMTVIALCLADWQPLAMLGEDQYNQLEYQWRSREIIVVSMKRLFFFAPYRFTILPRLTSLWWRIWRWAVSKKWHRNNPHVTWCAHILIHPLSRTKKALHRV